MNKLVLGNLRLRKKDYPENVICIKREEWAQYLWTWRQSVVPNDVPRDFGPVIAFGAKFHIPVARHWGREMSARRPFVTNPFHPLGSACNNKSFLYTCQNVPVISSTWCVKVCLYMGGIWQLPMCFSKTLELNSRIRSIIQLILTWLRWRAGAYWYKNLMCACRKREINNNLSLPIKVLSGFFCLLSIAKIKNKLR